jgi:redox-sensitive bicupin YhaK (pirin superfamily)
MIHQQLKSVSNVLIGLDTNDGAGVKLNEGIYWHGPIVMNTEEQIREALSDLRNNRFVREKNPTVT